MTRLANAWRTIEPEQRLAALAALGLFASMFLPWYSKTDTVVVHDVPKATATSLSAFQAFSFVEAAVLLVSAAVLGMLFARAEQRPFALPGGDGLMLMIAGGWSALLIFYRLLDKPGLQGNDRVTATVGVEWGIFVALLLALGLAYAGRRIRALERPGPPLRRGRAMRQRPAATAGMAWSPAWSPPSSPEAATEDEPTAVVPVHERGPAPRAPRRRPRYPPAPGAEQLSFEDAPTHPER